MSKMTFKPFLDKMGGVDASEHIAHFGELFYDPETAILRIGDGVTPGGIIINAIGNSSIPNPINQEIPYTKSEVDAAIAAAITASLEAFELKLYV